MYESVLEKKMISLLKLIFIYTYKKQVYIFLFYII